VKRGEAWQHVTQGLLWGRKHHVSDPGGDGLKLIRAGLCVDVHGQVGGAVPQEGLSLLHVCPGFDQEGGERYSKGVKIDLPLARDVPWYAGTFQVPCQGLALPLWDRNQWASGCLPGGILGQAANKIRGRRCTWNSTCT